MYIRLLSVSKFTWFGLVALFALSMGNVFALSTDNQQDIEIQSDAAEWDNEEGVAIYRGNVVVTQGSIRITGNVMTTHFNDDNDVEFIHIKGNPSTYRQLPDNSAVYDEAEALNIEYHAFKNLLILIDEALVTQENLRFSSNRIEYDTILNKLKAGDDRKLGSSKDKKKERVKIIIKNKQVNE